MFNPYFKLRSPDADSSLNGRDDSSAGSEKTDSGKVPDKTTIDTSKSDDKEKSFKSGLSEGQKRTVKRIAREKGYEIVHDEDGNIDFDATLDQIPSKDKKVVKEVKKEDDAEENERVTSAEKIAQKAQEKHEKYVANSEVRIALNDYKVKPKALDDVKIGFLNCYSIRENSEGEIRVYDGKKIVLNDDGKPISVSDAMGLYLNDHDWYLEAEGRDNRGPIKGLTGKPEKLDTSGLSERKKQELRQKELQEFKAKHS